MKCENCGAELHDIILETFFYDGTDGPVSHPFKEVPEDAVEIETTSNWTGYELTEEEMADSIKCPTCGKFPFKNKEVQVFDVVKVVLFKDVEINPDS